MGFATDRFVNGSTVDDMRQRIQELEAANRQFEQTVERLEQLVSSLYVLARECPSHRIADDFDFVTPLEQAEALEGESDE